MPFCRYIHTSINEGSNKFCSVFTNGYINIRPLFELKNIIFWTEEYNLASWSSVTMAKSILKIISKDPTPCLHRITSRLASSFFHYNYPSMSIDTFILAVIVQLYIFVNKISFKCPSVDYIHYSGIKQFCSRFTYGYINIRPLFELKSIIQTSHPWCNIQHHDQESRWPNVFHK